MKISKKTLIAVTATAAMLLSTACGSGTKAETTAKTTAATTEATTTTAEVTTEAPAETTLAETTTEEVTEAITEETTEAAEPLEIKTAPAEGTADSFVVTMDMPDGEKCDVVFSKDEWGSYTGTVEVGYLRDSLPLGYTSTERPDSFNLSEYTMTDSAETFDNAEFTKPYPVKAGDKIGSLTVKSAYTTYMGGYPGGVFESYLFDTVIDFDGTLTLSGDLFYAPEDDYNISVGDVTFIPNIAEAAEKKLPTAISFWGEPSLSSYMSDTLNFGIYGDYSRIGLGNMLGQAAYIKGVEFSYADKPEILAAFDGSKLHQSGTVTLSNLYIWNSDNFGIRNYAVIDSITLD